MLRFGEGLRRCRMAGGMTQEQVGEELGVSAQAVSRWENDAAYPDVVRLAGLAALYDVSVDTLLDIPAQRSKERLYELHREVQELMKQGDVAEAEQKIREGLSRFPGDDGLLLALGETLARDENRLEEAIAVGERVLAKENISMKARSTATVNLLFLYRRAGEMEKAAELLRTLPHVWESREMMAVELAENRSGALKDTVLKMLSILCRKIDEVESIAVPDYVQLGMDHMQDESAEVMLGKIRVFLRM